MPTILTHALIPLIGAGAVGKNCIPLRLAAAGVIAAVLPDADVIAFLVGMPYDHELGHRGASHSLVAALFLGLLATGAASWLRSSRLTSFLFVSISALSHGLTDMLTNGGRGVGLLWPFDDTRFFALFRPIEVSPIGVRFFSDGGFAVLASELLWLLVPVSFLGALIATGRRSLH